MPVAKDIGSAHCIKKVLPPLPDNLIIGGRPGQKFHFITKHIQRNLADNFNEEKVRGAQLFFREGFRGYGVTKKQVNIFVHDAFEAYYSPVSEETAVKIAGELFHNSMYEECQAAIIILERRVKNIDSSVLTNAVGWLNNYVENWAVCDSLCLKVISRFYGNNPQFIPELFEWSGSPNRWRRRAACVTLSKLTRDGSFYQEAFQLANLLLKDPDEMVQKGVGWLLKETSRARANQVIDFLNSHRGSLPQRIKSYAMERMDAAHKAKVLK